MQLTHHNTSTIMYIPCLELDNWLKFTINGWVDVAVLCGNDVGGAIVNGSVMVDDDPVNI